MRPSTSLPDIRKLILIHAPIEEVWKFISSGEGIASWWMPSTFEPVVGHAFVLHTNAGDSMCKLTEFNPPKGRHARVGMDWGKDWHLRFRLIRFNTITEITLIHSGWDADKVTEFGEKHPVVRNRMDREWDEIVKVTLPATIDGRRGLKTTD